MDFFIFQLLKSGGAGSGNGFGGRNLTSPTSSPSKRPRKLKSPVPSGSFHYGSSGHHTPMSTGSSCSALGLMPMSAPAKICQTSPALDLLENKKKVQRNSLYHWILWREALRGKKDRANPNSPMPLARSRLSFNWKVGVAWNKVRSRPLPSIGALFVKCFLEGEERRFVQKHPLSPPVPDSHSNWR